MNILYKPTLAFRALIFIYTIVILFPHIYGILRSSNQFNAITFFSLEINFKNNILRTFKILEYNLKLKLTNLTESCTASILWQNVSNGCCVYLKTIQKKR